MKKTTKQKLACAFEECEEENRSIEYTIQYMQDYAGVDHQAVIEYLINEGGFSERKDVVS